MFSSYRKGFVFIALFAFLAGGCQQSQLTTPTVSPASLRDVPAQRLGYRFENDVPPPPNAQEAAPSQEKLSAIQIDFDQNRPGENLTKTVTSPDKQRVLAIYQRPEDEKGEFRLDLYDAGGKVIRKITPDALALLFPDVIAWSPDGSSVAFSGARRVSVVAPNQEIIQEAPTPPSIEPENQNADNAPPATPAPSPTATAQTSAPILMFRTEQIYLFNRDGGDLKPLTQREGLIYFHFVWSPDSVMLAALSCKEPEWTSRPAELRRAGRPRLVEKNGRERLLDDNLTDVFPVFSPDSAKVATAYGTDVRIYDAQSNAPTSAAMPLQVPLLTSSQAFDAKQANTTAQQNAGNVALLPS